VKVLDYGAGEDVAPLESALRVAVLAWFGRADFENLARFALEHCVATFAQSRCLYRIREGGIGIAGSLVLSSQREIFALKTRKKFQNLRITYFSGVFLIIRVG
jgi:hypothetical protein